MDRQAIVLVLNLADQFFEDVFQRDQAHHLAGAVADQGDVRVLADQPFQAGRQRQVGAEAGHGPQNRAQRGLVRPAQPHQGHEVLEIDVAQDRLRIAGPLGHGKPRVHVEVGRDQALAQATRRRSAC